MGREAAGDTVEALWEQPRRPPGLESRVRKRKVWKEQERKAESLRKVKRKMRRKKGIRGGSAHGESYRTLRLTRSLRGRRVNGMKVKGWGLSLGYTRARLSCPSISFLFLLGVNER